MRAVLLAALPLVLAAAGATAAEPLPVEETTYVERSLNRYAPLTIEHPPVPRNPRGRRASRSAEIAGFCRDGGLIRRYDEAGAVIVRQREICDNIAPRTLAPGTVDPRPTWPAVSRVVVRSKG
ncbi:hypothetical protein [Methylobacterium isbiliense]|jgi:hypothetical protein|uniref:PASTA domain-containing protein n=1 Tax=Methylobacterium isbiliense TaxID=315478 RepID=A0ABQ4SEE2_9HYPH|nr:hypothetical protein [Methylobacterium isbiliense]MDN3621578.1 hypothetical protein [Methylobacterium isbiliense]GJE00778.1 hypothetical protein GMJLKIPL_2704 [Methylobacterium isbiliense]